MKTAIDFTHSQIQFTVRHMMISKVRGTFEKFDGVIDLNPDRPQDTRVEVQIDASSINTRDANRDAHLRSPDFLNAEQYPHLTFKSTSVEVISPTTARLNGDLTIRGVTKPVSMDVEFAGKARSPWGVEAYGFTAHTEINRKDWGLVWNQALETGGVLVGEEISIDIELELTVQPEAEAAASAD